MRKGNVLYTIAMILLIVGGLNWGLVGAFNFDLVAAIFGAGSIGARIVYVLVGLSAIIAAIGFFTQGADHATTRDTTGTYGSTGTGTATGTRPAPRI